MRDWAEIPLPKHRKTRWDFDHTVPITRGGKTESGNVRAICYSCNYKKNNNQ
ncbi:HNH endonuclease [Ancylobacter radicis]